MSETVEKATGRKAISKKEQPREVVITEASWRPIRERLEILSLMYQFDQPHPLTPKDTET